MIQKYLIQKYLGFLASMGPLGILVYLGYLGITYFDQKNLYSF